MVTGDGDVLFPALLAKTVAGEKSIYVTEVEMAAAAEGNFMLKHESVAMQGPLTLLLYYVRLLR